MLILYRFKMHAMYFCGIKACFLKLYIKDLINKKLAYHETIKPIIGRNTYYTDHECLD